MFRMWILQKKKQMHIYFNMTHEKIRIDLFKYPQKIRHGLQMGKKYIYFPAVQT